MVNGMNRQSKTRRREETLPAIQVRYLEDVDILQVCVGEIDGEWETLGQGLVAYYDSEGSVTGFWIDGASYIMKPLVDALYVQREGESRTWSKKPDAADADHTTQTAQGHNVKTK